LVDHARQKLLYNELAPLFELAADRNTEREVEGLCRIVSCHHPSARRILDLGCGVGRHTGRLLLRGYEVIGLDISAPVLEVARSTYPSGIFVLGDFRDFSLRARFDVVVIMWTTFNYLGRESEVRSFYASARRHLLRGGILVIDVANYQSAVPRDNYNRVTESDEHIIRVDVRKKMVAQHRVATYTYELQDRSAGSVTRYVDQEIARAYGLRDLVNGAGRRFDLIGQYGDYDLSPFDPTKSPRLIAVFRGASDARRPR
jgi:SAM-dependent methyltransferase